MRRLIAIVEGYGEVTAVPVLLHRIAREVAPEQRVVVAEPVRVSRSMIVQPQVLENYMEIAARRVGVGGGILVLLDADRDCPAELAPALLSRDLRGAASPGRGRVGEDRVRGMVPRVGGIARGLGRSPPRFHGASRPGSGARRQGANRHPSAIKDLPPYETSGGADPSAGLRFGPRGSIFRQTVAGGREVDRSGPLARRRPRRPRRRRITPRSGSVRSAVTDLLARRLTPEPEERRTVLPPPGRGLNAPHGPGPRGRPYRPVAGGGPSEAAPRAAIRRSRRSKSLALSPIMRSCATISAAVFSSSTCSVMNAWRCTWVG